MANRDILKEAIADAKAVKEAAIANAKVALEEAFTPFLKEKLAAQLAEIDEEMDEEMTEELDEMKDMEEDMYETKEMTDEIDLDELLRELDDMEETINDPRGQGAHGNIAPSSESDTDLMEAEEKEEEFDIEDMSEEDLKDFIEDVIADMVEAGELEAGHEGMGEEGEEEEEEEVDLDELLDEMKDLKPDAYYEKHDHASKSSKLKTALSKPPKFKDSDNEAYYEKQDRASKLSKLKRGLPKFKDSDNEAYYEKHEKMKEELEEAYNTIAKIKAELNEVNLLNSKLLYSNKVFKAKNLTESQKIKVLAAFDKATSKKEAKLVYETVMENLNTTSTPKRPVTESVRGMASRVITGAQNTKQPIIEVNSAFERMQKLAGIKK